jgi:hypothetical protein
MVDFHQLFAELVEVIQGVDFPDVSAITQHLNLDVSTAKISKTQGGLLAIYGAHLGNAIEIDIFASLTPRRALNLLFRDSEIPYGDVSGKRFGADQMVNPSKHGEGFAVVFQEGGLTCGLTASGAHGVVQSVFCEGPRLASTG